MSKKTDVFNNIAVYRVLFSFVAFRRGVIKVKMCTTYTRPDNREHRGELIILYETDG